MTGSRAILARVLALPFALALLCFLPGAALAQHGQSSVHAETMLPDMCRQMCNASLKVCDKDVAPDDPACLTRRVVCAQTCKPCLMGREECGKSGGDFSGCLSAYGACTRLRTDEDAPKHPRVSFDGGDGSSMDKAVILTGVQDETERSVAQDIWAALKHPGWRKTGQKQQAAADGRAFDVIDFDTPDGGEAQGWFVASAKK